MVKVNLFEKSVRLKMRQAVRSKKLLILSLLFAIGFIILAFATPSQAAVPLRWLAQAGLQKEQILTDVAQRISPDFKVPTGLQKRVGFWFDIYSKYTATQYVIHHVEYPWIIFEVIDTKDILTSDGNRWTNYHKAEKLVREARSRVKNVLVKLSRKKNFDNLDGDEARFAELLKDIPGKKNKVFSQAAHNIRSQLGQKDFMLSGLQSSQKYFPYIEQIFAEKGLPLEITRLPLVESSFNEAAFSKVGASGIWQLMPPIGKKFLKMNNDIDERNSPIKATTAAAKLLDQNFKILKTWPLAVTAYNHGPGGLIRAQKKLKTNDISKIVEDYSSSSFGFASSNFFCSFLAALHVEKYQKELFGDVLTPQSLEVAAIELPQSVKIKSILTALNLESEELRILNLDIKKKSIDRNRRLPKGYRLFIPKEHVATFETFLDSLPQSVTQKDPTGKRGAKL
jgi:membrane-bound lytic murein transglycosylase D